MMKTNRQLKAKYEPKAEYLLSGKLFCAKCGCTMKGISGHSGGNGEVYRYCACSNPQCRKRNIPKDDLEGKVIRSICDHLLQPETMELLAETMVEVQKADMEKPNAERDVLEQELRDVRRRSKNIIHMRSMSTYPDGYATREYRASVDKAAALVEEKKQKVSPYYHEKLDALLDSYARRLAQWTDDHNRNGASCPSVLVCGAGNFPVRKKQKQNAREDTLWHEYEEIEAILTKIKAVGTGPVDLADPHARELLTDQLNKEQDLLEYCKGANAYYRKHKTLRGYSNMSDAAADALTNPDAFSMSLYRKPYGDFELTSIRGKIKRIQTRLDELDKVQAAAASGPVEDQHDGYTYRENNEIMRVQFIFPGKPDDETRAMLKENGFRWAPSQGAWQRQLTANAKYAAHRVMEFLDGNENE